MPELGGGYKLMVILNTWHLVETLIDEEMSVVSCGGAVRDWASVTRQVQPAPDLPITPIIHEAVHTRRAVRIDVRSRKGAQKTFHIEALPVLGPSGEAHGVQVWVGEPGQVPSPPRIVAGIAWELERMVIGQTVEASMMSGVLPEAHVPERTPAEYIAKAVKFDDSASLFELGIDPVHGRKWEAPMSVLHADGRVMRWYCWGKGRTDPGNVGIRLLWHDVSDTTAPELPTLSELGMQEMLRTAGVYTGVFAAELAVLTMWLPDAPPWVTWRNVSGGNDIVHPDDRSVLAEALAAFRSGDAGPRSARARLRSESGWRTAQLSISPYPGPLSDRLVLVQVSVPAGEFGAPAVELRGSDRGRLGG
ncbi:DUF5593 domain-containing protein [Rhodococcus sp. HM1]|uniref:GAF domain-containing protein n=1 Tax=Rhodococcus sp. HM1 TaxID=2937759 RepID=UPI00200A417B|nr:GAF domain-containing protein [Rhodococcus sp. HM1]MCK8674574.1 DUF5593 domain-containing protein [Rhodococcus sp. HM1]